jgi:2,3-dihydroxybenzoate-AMP ligase/mycobactin salicyl-AMP ligase
MAVHLEGFTPYDPQDAERYNRLRWWPGLTLGDLLDKAADIYPDREAFVDGRSRLTFSQAREQSDRLALGLAKLGVRPGDRVLVQLPNWNEFVAAYFAVQKVGASVVLLIDRYRQHEINHLIQLTGASGWIVPESMEKTDFRPIVADVCRDNPQMQHVVLVRAGDDAAHPTLEQLVESNPLTPEGHETLAGLRPDPMAVAHMGPTGGTTGLPKVVPRTHNSLVCGVEYAARAWDYDANDTCLLAGPVGHDLTFSKGFLGGVFTYARLILLDSAEMGAVCRTIQEEKVSAIVWVPTLANRLVNYPQLAEYDLSSLKKMHSGGAASQPEMIRKVAALGCTYYNGYGGTEGQTTITRREDDFETVCGSVGKPTCPYDSYRVVDFMGQDVPAGTPG